MYDGEQGIVLEPVQGNWALSTVDLGYNDIFHISVVISVTSRLVRDFWGTLCTSIKQIKAPYLFDWEQLIAHHVMQGYQASSFSEWEV